VSAIAGRGGRARFVAADLANAEDVERLAADAGEVDILVNNAGVYEFTSTPDTTAHSVDRHLAINTRAPFQLVAALAPGMAKTRPRRDRQHQLDRRHLGRVGVGAAYGASKAAVETLTRYWATEFGGAGVRSTGSRPGRCAPRGRRRCWPPTPTRWTR
jgi:NAD(P)-dependent dehydrogenase (short-subunit alcohol dehydrogenase family)